jgi:hypothetical protein
MIYKCLVGVLLFLIIYFEVEAQEIGTLSLNITHGLEGVTLYSVMAEANSGDGFITYLFKKH